MQEKNLEITINGVELTEWLKANKKERAIIFAIVSESSNENNHHVSVGTCGSSETLLRAADDLMENKHARKWITAAAFRGAVQGVIDHLIVDDEDADDTETPAEKPEENDQQ